MRKLKGSKDPKIKVQAKEGFKDRSSTKVQTRNSRNHSRVSVFMVWGEKDPRYRVDGYRRQVVAVTASLIFGRPPSR
jgi:hypothetical protein